MRLVIFHVFSFLSKSFDEAVQYNVEIFYLED